MANPRHRVSVAIAHARSEITAVADASVWSMDPAETTATLAEITRLKSQLAELELRVVEHADADSIDAWTHTTKQTRPVIRAAEKLAFALTERHHVRDALAAGDLLVEQARVIAQALDALPADLDPATVVKAEAHLVRLAHQHHVRELRYLGKRLLEVVAPEVADADARTLQGPARMGAAFARFIEDRTKTTLVVTMTYESLLGDLEQAGIVETGERISPGMARRLACTAGIRPAVLGGKSEVLDLGRTRRLHSKAQRIAIALRDQHCTHPGCDWPPAMCHVHHDHEWAKGGHTDLANGRLLCPRHHTAYHRRT